MKDGAQQGAAVESIHSMSRKSFMSVMNVNVKIVELDVCTASTGTEDRAALRVVLRRAQDEAEDDAGSDFSYRRVEVARGWIRGLTCEVWRPCLLTWLRVVRKTPNMWIDRFSLSPHSSSKLADKRIQYRLLQPSTRRTLVHCTGSLHAQGTGRLVT